MLAIRDHKSIRQICNVYADKASKANDSGDYTEGKGDCCIDEHRDGFAVSKADDVE